MKTLVPRPYQKLIRDRILKKKRTAIWAFMGSGKTAATLLAIDLLKIVEDSPVLIVAPKLVAQVVWSDEVAKWSNFRHLTVSTVVGALSTRNRALAREADIYTVNFEQLPWLVDKLGDEWPFKTVVVDESSKLRGFRGSIQTSKTGKKFLRAGGTSRASALAKVAFSKVDRFIELTGTPAPNGIETLWGQMWFLDAGRRLGNTFSAFSRRWFSVGWDKYSLVPHPHAEEEVRERIADITFALRAEDWFDLKKPIVTNVMVELPPKARRMYREMEKDFYTEINKRGVNAPNAAVKAGKCSQLANGAVYVEEAGGAFEELHTSKIAALDRIVEEAGGMPVLVVYQFKHDLKRLLKAFPKGRKLDGKPATVKKWNSGGLPLMFLHAASAGHGNNFQDGGNIIVCFGMDWDLELYEQVLERIGPVRQLQSGHDRAVFVYHILAKGTIDELKLERLRTKASVQELLLREASKRL